MNLYRSLKFKLLGLGVAVLLASSISGCTLGVPLAQADVNSDGLIDEISYMVVNHGNHKSYDVRVALNNGDGAYFEPQIIFSLRSKPFDFTIGDLTNDGFVDISFSLEDELFCRKYLAPGSGDNSFGSPRSSGFCED